MVTASFLPRGSNKILLAALLLVVFIFSSTAIAHAQEENEQLKRNICGGANLSLSKGGDTTDGFNRSCDKQPTDGTGDPSNDIDTRITGIINILSVAIGVIAVVFIIVGGLRFVTSGGDSGKVSSAKNMIIYAVVGLVLVALAQSLVKFVIHKFAL